MSNQWNEMFDGLFKGVTGLVGGLQKKSQREDADSKFHDFKKKIFDGYNTLTGSQNDLNENKMTPSITNNQTEGVGVGLQLPLGGEPRKQFNPFDMYGHYLDLKQSLNDNPYGKDYTNDAENLMNLVFGKNFSQIGGPNTKFMPDEFGSMGHGFASGLNRRQLFDGLMYLNGDVRNGILKNNDFARNVYRKKVGKAWIDGGGGSADE
jgi:hypothetical protein